MLSVRDNRLLDADDLRLHYRTPTLGGSSGSPVFNRAWELIALHHAGLTHMPQLNGQHGTYPANEGIWIDRIIHQLGADLK
jgi:V8-like Glu-specific endopeptidase